MLVEVQVPLLMASLASSHHARVVSVALSATADRTTLGTLDVPSLGMGTLNWPIDKERDVTAAAACVACLESGVDFFDTAEAYGFGKSEKLTRDCLRRAASSVATAGTLRLARSQPATVATKYAPVPWRRSPVDDVVAACRASAERLGVDSVDLYQVHWPDFGLPLQRFLPSQGPQDDLIWEGLAKCYELGLAKNVGVSNYGPELTRRAHAALAARGVPLASNQINYSLLSFGSKQPTLDACAELGVRVLGYFPLANGLLAGRYSPTSMPKGIKANFMKKYIAGGVTQGGVAYPEGGAMPLLIYI